MKTVNRLTEISVDNASPSIARREIPDGGGLYLVLHPSGLKSWAVRYGQGGKRRKLTIPGAYPTIGLKVARKLAREALERVAGGHDPAADKITARRAAAAPDSDYASLAGLFLDRWLTKQRQRPKVRTIEQNSHLLGLARDGDRWVPKAGGLAQRWKGRAVAAITRPEIVDVLDELVAAGLNIKANRQRAVLHTFFGWCWRRGLLDANPVAAIDRPAAESSRDRVLADWELALLWRAADGDPVFGPLYKFLTLTGQRRDEARGATWDEFDLETGIWTIPAGRAKNGREHELPLSDQAVDLLSNIPRIGRRPPMVFTTTGTSMISGMARAKRRLDERMLAIARQENSKATIVPWVLHDLRRTCATGLQRLGVALPVIEKVLNHTSGSFAGIVGVYQRHDFADEKKAALDGWARHIISITAPGDDRIVEFRQRVSA